MKVKINKINKQYLFLNSFKYYSSFNKSTNYFDLVPLAPPDKILGVTEQYSKCEKSNKINLGVGIYRNENGNPLIFSAVKEAEKILLKKDIDKDYTSIIGSNDFRNYVRDFIFNFGSKDTNKNKLITENRILTVQSLSGTGALRVAAEFLRRFYTSKEIYISNPTWSNHVNIFRDTGFNVNYYPYFNSLENSLDFENMITYIESVKNGSVLLLHACCHNPTGFDLSTDQWDTLLKIIEKKDLLPLVDMAYQGFSTGDPFKDSFLIRKLNSMVASNRLRSFITCQSFSKNMGLYGERVGSLSFVLEKSSNYSPYESQIKKIIRPIYSSPPIHGSRIVQTILNPKNNLIPVWLNDLSNAVNRLNSVRLSLYEKLDKNLHNWESLLKQKGMFIYTGLNKKQCLELKNNYNIFTTDDGRFSISSVNSYNLDYLVQSINKVLIVIK